jgi:cytochrome c oxidase cbb3-type subunit 3/ubiquinol-cytochrome c reductase cytochrome c subunit
MMTYRLVIMCLSLGSFELMGCHLPGKPSIADEVPRPEAVTSFDVLYKQNCAGCHGADGQNGPATNLANPEYQALVDDASLRQVITDGEKGTLMPAFGVSSGGNLTTAQIDSLVHGLRERWSRQNLFAGQNPPPYRAVKNGDVSHGQQVYAMACARCHGATARQPGSAGSILDDSFLALVNNQMIRTTIISGRPDLGHPDWRGDIPGRPLTDAEVTDVTAWIIAQRPPMPGQPYPNTGPTAEPPGESKPVAPAKP